jgi:hypothetical protein
MPWRSGANFLSSCRAMLSVSLTRHDTHMMRVVSGSQGLAGCALGAGFLICASTVLITPTAACPLPCHVGVCVCVCVCVLCACTTAA